MDYGKVVVEDARGLLRVAFGPDSTIDDWKVSLAEVLRLADQTGFQRVLVDVRAQESVASTFKQFEFAAQLPQKIAFAVLCDLHLEAHRFIETVAVNRGAPVKLFFDDQTAALQWLASHS